MSSDLSPLDARGRKAGWVEVVTQKVTQWTGSVAAFVAASLIVVVWAVTGPVFHYSDTWQLVINTGTTIITFLMVFLIQRAQNKDTLAMQLKLNEIIAAVRGASNRLINVESLSEDEVRRLHERYQALAEKCQHEAAMTARHTIEEEEEEDCEGGRLCEPLREAARMTSQSKDRVAQAEKASKR